MTDKINYDPRITPEFIFACAKHAAVEVMSSQVSLSGRSLGLSSLEIPHIYQIQWIGTRGDLIQLTLKLKDGVVQS